MMDSNSALKSHLDAIRLKVTRNFCIFCFGIAILAVPSSFMAKDHSTLIINAIGAVFYAIPLVVVLKTGRYRLAAKIFVCTAITATLANAIATNLDIHIPTVVWYFVYLVFADLVLNVGWAIGIAGISFVSVTIFSILRLTGHNVFNPTLMEESIIIGSPVALFVAFIMLLYLLMVYKKVRDLMFRKLVESNMEKNRLVGTMSHDLRNYFGAITGVASLIRDDMCSPGNGVDRKEITRHLDIIDNASFRALALVEDVIGAVRDTTDSGRKIYFEELDLREFIAPILQRYVVLACKKGIRLIDGENSDQIRVSINKDAFSRVVENLLSNALKFCRDGDTVTVSAKCEDGNVVLAVADTGIGIPVEIRDAVFEPYTKSGRPGTDNEKSIGLGLSIVKKFVDLHSGKVWFESEVGKGTTFYIRLKRI